MPDYDSHCPEHAQTAAPPCRDNGGRLRHLHDASVAHRQVYKCTNGTGSTTCSDFPCGAGSKPLRLPDDTKGSNTNPNACAQLLDETQRLAAEAERNAKRGRA